MNRMTPLVSRRPRRRASFPAAATFGVAQVELENAAGWLEDAKLFADGWVAGLVIFGTLIA
jgi:hypothetical protein